MRAFLVTAESGSLSAAARALGLTQPTLSRQVAALENELGVMLFERVGRALVPTQAGRDLAQHGRAMMAAADRVAIAASGQSQTVQGTVRISAIDVIAVHLLPRALTRIRAEAPRLKIEVIATDDISDLMRREADIAIRHLRPDQPDLVARLLGNASAYFYAAPSYLAQHGTPKTKADLSTHSFISFGDTPRVIDYYAGEGIALTPENFPLTSANGMVSWQMVRAGLGIAPMDARVGALCPDVVQLLPQEPPIPFPVWLTTHREIHTSRRIRLVFDILAEELRV